MARPTFADIARNAGVGTATVERVLNGRGGVRPATVERVLAAARALDYPRRLPEVHRGILRIEVILVLPETTFYRRLSRAFERIAATLDPVVRVHRTFADESDLPAIAALIASGERRRAGLILAVPDHPSIRAAVEAVAPALPVVHVVTRAHPELGELVAIDNYAAGRTAGHFLTRMQRRPGGLVAIGHPIYQVHRERLRGFSDYLTQAAGPQALRWVGFGQDEARRCGDVMHRALETWPDLVGVYNVGAGTRAVADVLRRHPRGRDVFYVGHELSDASVEALRDGSMRIVLDQAPEAQARRSIDIMLNRLGLLKMPVDAGPIRFVTITAESL